MLACSVFLFCEAIRTCKMCPIEMCIDRSYPLLGNAVVSKASRLNVLDNVDNDRCALSLFACIPGVCCAIFSDVLRVMICRAQLFI